MSPDFSFFTDFGIPKMPRRTFSIAKGDLEIAVSGSDEMKNLAVCEMRSMGDNRKQRRNPIQCGGIEDTPERDEGVGDNETAPSLFRDGFGSLNRSIPNRVLRVIDCTPPISAARPPAAFPNRGPPLPANYPERAHSCIPEPFDTEDSGTNEANHLTVLVITMRL
ncbi:hypothetical protein CDAR_616081 [Caerostris darwini]|uniref:Uncharacterized protein n=1 Tax=Caerostris darwini TaxID=1538125 RepID=A0AAV4RZM2_9ARAC|nr:hypothetical protein CDAR_616081 [Caerostris darwini]